MHKALCGHLVIISFDSDLPNFHFLSRARASAHHSHRGRLRPANYGEVAAHKGMAPRAPCRVMAPHFCAGQGAAQHRAELLSFPTELQAGADFSRSGRSGSGESEGWWFPSSRRSKGPGGGVGSFVPQIGSFGERARRRGKEGRTHTLNKQ